MIVVSDGFSSDRTIELANIFQPYNGIKKIVTKDMVSGGKGAGVKTILEIAHQVNAKSVVLLDGDLLNIKPEWVYEFALPILYGRTDLIVPYYIRDKYDGVITNNLIYPFTRALYRLDIRQPIAGEYGLSKNLYEMLRAHPLFPLDFGIDIFIVTSAVANSMEIREGLFCLKLHESTTRYSNPEELIIPMFREVTDSMFSLAHYYEGFWRNQKNGGNITTRDFYCKNPIPIKVGLEEITAHFKHGFNTSKQLTKNILPEDVMIRINKVMKGDEKFDEILWAETVYNFAAYYKNLTPSKNKFNTLNALKTLWLGRFVEYVVETKDMDLNGAEAVIQRQAQVFEDKRDYLIFIY
jgi:hypothetical protein